MTRAWLFCFASGVALACGHAKSLTAVASDAPVDAVVGPSSDAVDEGSVETHPIESFIPTMTATINVMSAGETRPVVMHVPGHFPNTPLALVLNMHGSGGNAEGEEASSGMDLVADANGFIVAYPQGGIPLGGGFAWNVPGQPLSGGGAVPPGSADDAVFLADAIAAIERMTSVDPKRVYATGLSGGGRMASQVGCDLSTILAAVAPVAGLRFPAPCNSARPVPVISFHETGDPVNPYGGNGDAYWTYSVPIAAERWAAHDMCGSTPTVSQAAPGVRLTSYAGCTGAGVVDLYTIDGTGHEWPGGPGQTTAIDASTVMWRFFLAHPLP